MRACLELLAEGKVELPIAEVAERSGVNRGTVYRWWPTSTELLTDALAFHARHRLDTPDTGAWESDVRALVTQLASLAADPVERGIMATMISGRYPSLDNAMMSWYRNDLPHWLAMIGRGIGRGEVSRDVDPAMVLQMMLTPAVSISLFDGRALTRDEIDSLVTLVCRATTVPRSPATDPE
ncbi:TetR/AcrR family transcriptional regulator C-terminal ligand-binding domain-containing protein [Mycolicibacterium neworleansense]|uniref:TetR family transcriptional regulator n=1 Tax=Mycolicibacterium neworleansense TaxID=146018 RepID=A0A0H5RQQ5_9MYCO|nr:TetR/AcrR family transcriptional regulator C-terminal ligand-binding domain-containing protein [Mycolicibacterium neworleansense]MCV7365799.1 TetR/AcrR family transcriptional regulator C-terminal ligand-binding domain-containing protein [Mycolicibacterium neworleansense]CRZ16500.1 TetR family transcriptional regulator [Mycolicibacterium neworleansense]